MLKNKNADKHLVAIVPCKVRWTDGTTDDIVYYLYDNGKRRWYDVSSSGRAAYYASTRKSHKMFMTKIEPWLRGVDDEVFIGHYYLDDMEPTKCVPKYDETWVDKLYNWYCERKGRFLHKFTEQELSKIFEVE